MSNLTVRLISASVFASTIAITGVAQAQSLSDIPSDLGRVENLNGNVRVDSPQISVGAPIVESPQFSGPISVPVSVDSPQTQVDVKVPVGAAQVLPGAVSPGAVTSTATATVAPGAVSKGAVDIHGNTMMLHLGAIGTPLQQSNRLCGANTFSAGTGGFNVVIGLSPDDYCDRLKAQDGVKILQRATDFLSSCPTFETPSTQIKLAGFLAEAQTSGGKVKKTLPALIETSRNFCTGGSNR
jgi:hypothetical protein